MKKKSFQSFDDFSSLKDHLERSTSNGKSTIHKESERKKYLTDQKQFAENGRSSWEPVFRLLENKLFDDIASGLIKKISSSNYSVVTAVLTYPTVANPFISQDQLDKAHSVAHRIKRGVNSGRIKYTHAKVPSPWRIGGNPGTKK
jgi:hypothetical protein